MSRVSKEHAQLRETRGVRRVSPLVGTPHTRSSADRHTGAGQCWARGKGWWFGRKTPSL